MFNGTIYPMDTTNLKVGIYARISDDKDGQQTATARQMEDCRAFAGRKGWEVADEFEDIDTSAYLRGVKRPEFERMLTALREGNISGVVVWKLDRLTRQQRDLVRVIEACEPHRAFVASVMEPIDTRESYGQFVAELLVAQARMESANSSTRGRRKAQEQREKGMPPPCGKRCFGYAMAYTQVVPEEAAIIREVRDRLFAGEGLYGICSDLEARGILGTQGHAWRTNILKRLLVGPSIAGVREGDGKRYPGTWQAIISPEDSDRLRAMLNPRPGAPRRSPARRYLLTGFMRCGRCDHRMAGHVGSDGHRRYVCGKQPGYPNCGRMSIRTEPVDDMVREMLMVAVDDTALAEALHARGDQDDGLLEAIRRDEGSLETLSRDFYVEQILTREEFLAARDGLVTRLEANRTRLSRRDGRGAVGTFLGRGETLRQAWEAGSNDWRRSVVGALLDHVVILPGLPGRIASNPDRVKPVWRY